jgi:hypothetical protein
VSSTTIDDGDDLPDPSPALNGSANGVAVHTPVGLKGHSREKLSAVLKDLLEMKRLLERARE